MVQVNEQNADESARVLKEFLKEFDPSEIKIKPAMVKGNRCLALHYIDSRLVMDRLDEVVGVGGWSDRYTVLPNGEVECQLSVKIAGEWITKADVGGQSEQPDEGDRMKAAYSDALKRAAVKFGIGRFLYRRKQEWMDYDPVKKQVIRPNAPSRPAERPQSAPARSQTQQPAAGNAQSDKAIVDQFEGEFKKCGSEKQRGEIWKRVVLAKRDGTLTPMGAKYLEGVAVEAADRLAGNAA